MAIADIHEDIIRTHILSKLDGQTLAAAGCASSHLKFLCSDQKLWSDICSSNWPSTNHPLITKTISGFTSGHRSFYSDTFPSPAHYLTTTSSPQSTQLISAVDLKYNNKLVLSKVVSTTTAPTDWFQTSPFRVDVLEPKEFVSSSVEVLGYDVNLLLMDFEKNMELSWIMIDPTLTRSMNLSSVKPVSVQLNWLSNDIELSFGVVIGCENEHVHVSCNIQITCGVKQGGGEVNVSGVSLTVLDMDGKCLSGKGSMIILQGLLEAERWRDGREVVERERYDEYIRKRRERNEKTERRERQLDMALVAGGVAMFMAFWSFALC